MLKFKFLFLVLGALSLTSIDLGNTQAASYNYYRQYYESSWSYNNNSSYYYRRYYYYPTVQATTYSYHYTIYYPTYPRYVYYYNPVKRYYWGRYDLEDKGYSLLKEEDRKENLKDIKEEAFPKPAKMPNIPESTDNVVMDAPPGDLPKEKK